MNRLIIPISLFFTPFMSFADDCVRNDPEPIVTPDHHEISRYKVYTNTDNHLVEEVELKSGQRIFISQYGCAHFGLSYKFEVSADFSENLVSAAKRYLKLVSGFAPTFSESLGNEIDGVSDNFPTPELIPLEPGYDWIYLTTENEGDVRYFIITYDVAL